MRRIRPWTVGATLVLLLSGLLAAPPAGAAVGPLTVDCLSDTRDALEVTNGETVTWTVVGSGCYDVYLGGATILGTLTVDGVPIASGTSALLSPGSTVVYNAPAMGSGYQGVYFSGQGSNGAVFIVSFPPAQASFVDNGNGTVTVTFVGNVLMVALPEGSSCPPYNQIVSFYRVLNTLRGEEDPVGATSPYTQGADPNRIPAGAYEGCLYYPYLSNAVVQSGPIYIGQPAPTTTTTTTVTPVTPAFTG